MNGDVQSLRALVDGQQYVELEQACLAAGSELDDGAVRVLLALAYSHLGNKQAFDACFGEIEVQQDSLDNDALCDLAAIYIAQLRIDGAIVLLDKVIAENPKHDVALARLAWCRMAQEEYDSALHLFYQSLELNSGRLAVYVNIIQIYLQQSQLERAPQMLSQASDTLATRKNELTEQVAEDYQKRLDMQQLQLWVALRQFEPAEQWLEEVKENSLIDNDEYISLVSLYANHLAQYDAHDQAQEILRNTLKDNSDNTVLLLQLAELAQVQGHAMQAVAMLKKAITDDEDNSELWVKLSGACLHQMDKQARHAAEKANDLAQALSESSDLPAGAIPLLQANAKNSLAMVESNEQNYDVADGLFREIIELHPRFIPALQGLGQQQMQQGNIDEAIALFEQVKLIDPIKGHSSLINARQFPEDEETLAKLEKAANMPSIEGSVRSGILFQLASAWEKRKDYDKAFELVQQANNFSQQFLKYNDQAHRNSCARIRYAFSKSLYQNRKDCGIDSHLPVYVLGMPRSGTTLVEQIIAGHSQIFGAGELGVIPQIIQGLNRWERHTGSGRQYPDCVDDLTPYVVEGIANNALKELQEFEPSAKHVVDKLPHNFENIGLIKFLFPHAKIISVRRDPRDIAMSNYFTDYQAKHGGMGFAYDLTHIGEQLADHNMMMHHWNEVFPGEILEINYEDVVDDIESSARKMLDYIGVDWEPDVLKFNELDRSVKTASVWQVRQPIYKTSKAKWMRYKDHLAPLTQGTNKPIEFDDVEMLSLPEPGFLTTGVEHYQKGELNDAEMSFKKMLHHNPDHAASNYMVGLVYLSKGHMDEGVEQLKKALDKAPWKKEWRDNLKKAMEESKVDNIEKTLNTYLQRAEDEVENES